VGTENEEAKSALLAVFLKRAREAQAASTTTTMPLEELSINTLAVLPAVEGGKVSTKKGAVDDDRLPRDSNKSTPLALGGAQLLVEVEEEEELLETATTAQCEKTACLQACQPFLERSTIKDEGGSTLW